MMASRARALAQLVLLGVCVQPSCAQAAFSFVDFFEGEWEMEKSESGGMRSKTAYVMAREGSGLRGQYVDGDKTLEVVVQPDTPQTGQFLRADDNEVIFSYDFAASGGMQISHDTDKGTTFTVTSPSSFLLLVATSSPGDIPTTKTWTGVRKAAPGAAKPSGKPKSLLRKYGYLLVLAIIGLLTKQAYDASLTPAASGAGSQASVATGAKPAGGGAKGKSKKTD